MNHVEVSSSNVRSIGYDPEKRAMEVKFHGGGHYRYSNVPPEEHSNFLLHPAGGSHGKHFNAFIKDRFVSERL